MEMEKWKFPEPGHWVMALYQYAAEWNQDLHCVKYVQTGGFVGKSELVGLPNSSQQCSCTAEMLCFLEVSKLDLLVLCN